MGGMAGRKPRRCTPERLLKAPAGEMLDGLTDLTMGGLSDGELLYRRSGGF